MKQWKWSQKLITIVLSAIILVAGAFSVLAADGSDLISTSKNGTTRAEWLHDLSVTFDMTVEENNMPEDYFGDITSDYEYYTDIMKCVEFGVVDIEAGQNVDPDGALTRDFAAATMVYCLGLQLEEGSSYTFSETTGITNMDAAQIAVNRGWFALSNGAFMPDAAVTSAEAKTILDDAKTLQEKVEIDPNHDNEFEFADGVIEVPESIQASIIDDSTVYIYDSSYANKIKAGNTFAVYLNGIANAFKASSVSLNSENITVVKVSDVDQDTAITDMEAEGEVEGNLSDFIPEEDMKITYYEGGTQAKLPS